MSAGFCEEVAFRGYLQQQFRSIYGADVYLGNDSQDGQFLGVSATTTTRGRTVTEISTSTSSWRP